MELICSNQATCELQKAIKHHCYQCGNRITGVPGSIPEPGTCHYTNCRFYKFSPYAASKLLKESFRVILEKKGGHNDR